MAGRDVVTHIDVSEQAREALRGLPPDIAHFTGRRSELDRIEERLPGAGQAPLVVVIANGPGSGKSALAVHAAHRFARRFPAAQMYLRLGGAGQPPLRPDEALRKLLALQGVGPKAIPKDLDAMAALYRSGMDEGSVVVLDDVISVDQVERLLPSRPGCVALVTSRSSLSELEGTLHLDVRSLPAPEARALAERLVGAERAAAEPAALDRVVALCGGLPLALHIAGALLGRPQWRRRTLARFADRMADERGRLDLLRSGNREVRASFAMSYAALPDGAARLFRLLGTVRVPDFPDDLVLAVDGTGDADAFFGDLLDAHLIESAGDERARFHDLMALFAGERALAEETDEHRRAALDRALCWAADRVAGASADALAADADVLVALIAQAVDEGVDDPVWRLTDALRGLFEVRGLWSDWLACAESAVTAATRLDDPVALGTALDGLSWALRLTRRTSEALEAALGAASAFEAADERARLAGVHAHLGTLYRELHRHDEAVAALDVAGALYRELRDARGEGVTRQQLGHVLYKRRRLADAREALERAVDVLSRTDDHITLGWAHSNLISVYGNLWNGERALHHADRAREIFAALGFEQGLAWVDNHAGRVHRQFGRTVEQTACHERALAVFRRLDDRYAIAWATLDLALARGDADGARAAHDLFAEIGERDGRAWALVHRAVLEVDPECAAAGRDLFAEIGGVQGYGTARSVLGDLYAASGGYDAARREYEAALDPLDRGSDSYRAARTRWGLARLDRRDGAVERAFGHAVAALETFELLGAPDASDLRAERGLFGSSD